MSELLTAPAAELDNICRVVCARKVFDLPNEIRRFKPPNLQTFQRDRVEVIEDFAG
jgi:hypothetical protein